MTEEEAKTRWCPFATMLWKGENKDIAAMTRFADGTPVGYCIASACMAWRNEHSGFRKFTEAELKFEPVVLAEQRFAIEEGRASYGHCGLAGKP